MKELNSREYECPLRTEKVTQADTFLPALCDFVESLHLGVKFPDRKAKEAKYSESFYDVADRTFSGKGYRLRLRRSPKKTRCAYKAVAEDRYLVQDAAVLSEIGDAETRFEENVYPQASLYCRQTSVDADKAFQPSTVADWAGLFPEARQICSPAEPLQVIERRFIHRLDGFEMKLVKHKAEACLEYKYADEAMTQLQAAEFSWRYQPSSESEFDPAEILMMRRLLKAFSTSEWRAVVMPGSAEMMASLW